MTGKSRLSIPILIWGCAALFYFYQYIIRVSPSVTASLMMQDLSLQACSLGILASWYYRGYTVMQIPVGIMLDRFGVRYPLVLASLSCVTGCYLFASTDDITVMAFGRLLMGVGSAVGALSCFKTAAAWFDARYLPAMIGWTMLIGPFGGAVGTGTPFAWLVSNSGWRGATMILGLAGFGVALLAWLFVRDKAGGGNQSKTAPMSLVESLMVILRNPQTYLYALYGGMMYVPLSGFADLWGVPYVMHTYHLDEIEASGFVSQFYIGIAFGGPMAAWILNWVQNYKRVLFAGAGMTMVMFLVIIYVPLPVLTKLLALPGGLNVHLLDVLFLLAGGFSTVQFFAFACVCTMNPTQAAGTASGIHNTACMFSGIIFQPVIGMLLDWSWDGGMRNGAPLYTEGDFHFALASVPICLLIATVTSLGLREVYPQET